MPLARFESELLRNFLDGSYCAFLRNWLSRSATRMDQDGDDPGRLGRVAPRALVCRSEDLDEISLAAHADLRRLVDTYPYVPLLASAVG